MKKILKIVAIVVVAAFIIAQFFRPNRINPAVVETDALVATVHVPENVKVILSRSCADCHSNNTIYPWYSNISPVSWFLVDHVDHGRSHLNFSIWNSYDERSKLKKLDEIREQIDMAAMPLPSYLWLHRDAVLSEAGGKILKDWTLQVTADLEAAGSR